MKYNERRIRELIIAAFDDDELLAFCSDYFRDICDRFGSDTGKTKKAWLLVEYCRRKSQLEVLIEKIKQENPAMYEKHRAQLSEPDATYTPRMDEVRAGTAAMADLFKTAATAGTTVNTSPAEPLSTAAPEHPLAKTPGEIKAWFLERLTFDEQALLVTVALFSGLTRQELMTLYGDVKDRLRLPVAPAAEPPQASKPSAQPPTDAIPTVRLSISLEGMAQMEPPSAPPSTVEAQPKPKPAFDDESQLLDMAGLTTVDGQRNTEHGLSRVRLLDFRHPDYRSKVVHLLIESFPRTLDRLLPYLRQLGTDSRAVVRQRVAELAGELACELDFVQVKEALLLPWALDDDEDANFSAAIALDRILQVGCCESDIKALLKHWISVSNFNLNWTGLASLVLVGSHWPEETLTLIERVFREDDLTLLVLALAAIQKLCDDGPAGPVLTWLDRWFGDKAADPYLREAAALGFLDLIELRHLAGDGERVALATGLLLTGLSPSRLPDSTEIQWAMVEKLRVWAKEALDAGPGQAQQTMDALFAALYAKAPTQRDQDRLKFYVGRWSQQDKRFGRFAHDRIK
jgi:hypothetical protein